jgi:hypothetical protein
VVVDGRNRRGDGENWTETAASGSSLSTHDSLLLVHLLAHPIRLPALPGPVSCDCARLSKKIWSWRTPAPSLRSQPSGACGLEDYCAYRTLDSSLNSSQLLDPTFSFLHLHCISRELISIPFSASSSSFTAFVLTLLSSSHHPTLIASPLW